MSTGQPISEIEKINKKLVLNTNKALSDFDIKNGLKINGCHIQLDNIYNENNNFTMFVSFKHNTSFTDTTYTMGFGNNINRNLIIHFAPYIQVENNKFSLIKSSSSSSEVSILSQYQNKHIMLWFCKCGNLYELGLCSGTYHNSENVNVNQSFQANRKFRNLPYYVQKVGFSKNFYDLNSKYFYKILFLEISNGTYFG